MTTVSLRFDDKMKQELDEICDAMGINITTLFTIYAKKVIRDRKIPFDLEAPIPIEQYESKLLEAEEFASTHCERMTHEEVFDSIKKKISK